jgi:hypothetical protein
MIERTEFDLRLDEYRARVASEDEAAWMDGGTRERRTTREVLAAVLLACARRLRPAAPGTSGFDHAATRAARS